MSISFVRYDIPSILMVAKIMVRALMIGGQWVSLDELFLLDAFGYYLMILNTKNYAYIDDDNDGDVRDAFAVRKM